MRQSQSGPGTSALLVVLIGIVLILVAGGFAANQYLRPLPPLAVQPQVQAEREIGAKPDLPWPSKGNAAVWVDGFGLVATRGDDTPRPIASTTKIMTALIILENHPLGPGDSGPEVTITPADVADYEKAVREGQSAVPVRAGQKLTELQLIQGLLLPSGNNIADVLAKWDAGSIQAFVAKMNARAAALGMTRTRYDDASGFSPKTVSTASDLLALSAKAMTDPVFRQTVAMPQTTLPNAGVVYNVNSILGKDGNIGIKTGSTDEAGGCFVSASIQQVNGKPVEVYSAVLGQDLLIDALNATTALSRAAAGSFRQAKLLSRTDVAATITPAWGSPIQAVPTRDVEMLIWPGTKLKSSLQLDPIQAPVSAGAKVGTITLEMGKQTQQVDVVTTGAIAEPDWQWRTTRFLRGQ